MAKSYLAIFKLHHKLTKCMDQEANELELVFLYS